MSAAAVCSYHFPLEMMASAASSRAALLLLSLALLRGSTACRWHALVCTGHLAQSQWQALPALSALSSYPCVWQHTAHRPCSQAMRHLACSRRGSACPTTTPPAWPPVSTSPMRSPRPVPCGARAQRTSHWRKAPSSSRLLRSMTSPCR